MLEGVRGRRADAEADRSLESMKTLLEIKKMNTGALTFTTDSFWSKNKKTALAENSSLFQQLARTAEGRYILNTRPPEISVVDDPDPELLYPAEDGRVFNYDAETEEWSVMVNL